MKNEVEVWWVIAQVRSQLLSAESLWRPEGLFSTCYRLQGLILCWLSFLKWWRIPAQAYCKALPVCPYGVHLNLRSVKQIGVLRKEIHEGRGKAATNDALWLKILKILTCALAQVFTHLQEVSSVSGWAKGTLQQGVTLPASWVFSYKPNWTDFSLSDVFWRLAS